MAQLFVDPTHEHEPVVRPLAPRPARLEGAVTLVDISKPNGDVLLDRIAERLAVEAPAVTVRRATKPTYTRPAPLDQREEVARTSGLVIQALAD